MPKAKASRIKDDSVMFHVKHRRPHGPPVFCVLGGNKAQKSPLPPLSLGTMMGALGANPHQQIIQGRHRIGV
jgi:hypothetical protein